MDKSMIICKIDPEKMWFAMSICPPIGDDETRVSKDMVVEVIKEHGVSAPINMDAVEALCDIVEYGRDVMVVNGKPAVNGVDGHFEYSVDLEDKKAKPVVAEDGSVDYANSLEIAMVEEGEVFARYIPPTNGQFGFNIYNEMLKPEAGKPAKPLKGKGFHMSDDEKEYTAKVSGRIFTENGRIIIEPLYVVSGDLDITHGNIKFNGHVEVRGDMHSGTAIDAAGSIFISGHVGSCSLKAGENITIGKGVQGKGKCIIDAGGDVAGSFMERCTVHAGGRVLANSLLDCFVEARDAVIVNSKQGCIIGGYAAAMQYIQAKEVGNDAGAATKLVFGELPSFRTKIVELKRQLLKVSDEINTFEDLMKKIDTAMETVKSKDLAEKRRRVTQSKIIKMTEKKELGEQITKLEEDFGSADASSYITVSGVVYPRVIISTMGHSFTQEIACKEVAYRFKGGEIEMTSAENIVTTKTE